MKNSFSDDLLLSFKVSKFQSFKVSKFQSQNFVTLREKKTQTQNNFFIFEKDISKILI
jgi:hypothetical protein